MFGELDDAGFDMLAAMQDKHWWYRARRGIFSKIIASLDLGNAPKILEIGCGVGSELPMLSRFGNVEALKMSQYAREYASKRSGLAVNEGWLPDGLSAIEGKKFDLICMFDVLEHVEHDVLALGKIKDNLSVISGGGNLLVSVPAYQWLYTKAYDGFGHWRRYSRKELCGKLVGCGYNVLFAGYMNMFGSSSFRVGNRVII